MSALSKHTELIHVIIFSAESKNTYWLFNLKQLEFVYSMIKNKKFRNISVFKVSSRQEIQI